MKSVWEPYLYVQTVRLHEDIKTLPYTSIEKKTTNKHVFYFWMRNEKIFIQIKSFWVPNTNSTYSYTPNIWITNVQLYALNIQIPPISRSKTAEFASIRYCERRMLLSRQPLRPHLPPTSASSDIHTFRHLSCNTISETSICTPSNWNFTLPFKVKKAKNG